ncbi:MAG: hypothetical protein LLF97_00900 [Planctomycetaceae bacterium]|nr:hypothetical protein [Planctomycetaceae bacterium]
MTFFQTIRRSAATAFYTLVGWSTVAATALAQGPVQPQQPNAPADGNSYVFSYFLVLLGIGLGLIVLCRPGHRRDRSKPEQYDEKRVKVT